jgi:hypothetical protein
MNCPLWSLELLPICRHYKQCEVHWQKTKCYKLMANNITILIRQNAVLSGDSGGSVVNMMMMVMMMKTTTIIVICLLYVDVKHGLSY